MNQTQPYMDVHSSHLSSGQSYTSQAATAGPLTHYTPYQQPPLLQPASTYATGSYSQYGYANGVTSQQTTQPPSTTMTSQVSSQLLPLPAIPSHTVSHHTYTNNSTYTSNSTPTSQPYTFDTTGQICPPGAKPRVTATLWEDEGSLCYQVEAKGVCVARREDNHMINGTKLLNVAGMTRGRRDGILKSEKIRHVVKIGPMHLKGVWIPFERALDFANKEKITDLLYPLFVHNIGGLLYHPANLTRPSLYLHDMPQRRQLEAPPTTRTSQGSQTSTQQQQHQQQQQQQPQQQTSSPSNALIPHPSNRPAPALERAHTFPTPPTSASSLIPISTQGTSYEWGGQSMSSGVQASQPLSIESGLGSARSLPATPATTPPIQSMPSYQSQSGYDSSKPYYSAAPPSQTQYAPQPSLTFGPSLPPASYLKSEMGPPSVRASGGQAETENSEVKADRYSQGNGQVGGHGSGEGEPVQEQDAEYIHDNHAAYNANRGSSYTYTTNPSVGSLTGEASHLSSDMTGSPHQNGSGRITPRSSGAAQPQWAPGYNTSPRPAQSSSLYNIVSDSRGTSANGSATDSYSATSNSTSAYSSSMNGTLGTKRVREEDEDRIARPDSRGVDYDSKRRRTITETSVGGPVGGAPLALQPVKAGVMTRRR